MKFKPIPVPSFLLWAAVAIAIFALSCSVGIAYIVIHYLAKFW